jgi:hypothetical protein
MSHMPMGIDEGRLLAAIDMVGRMGGRDIRIGFSDEEDGEPVVWYACATFKQGGAEAAGALSPDRAAIRLVEQLADGGTCTHCLRPTGCIDDAQASDMPMNKLICWIAYDPELRKFRRSCEGIVP